MTRFLTKAALAATLAGGLIAAPATAADSEPFTATARIVSPLLLTKDSDLDFGTITLLPTLAAPGEDVVVGRAGLGGGTTSCGVNLNCTAPTVASFTVAGSNDQNVGITVVAPSTLDSGANTVAFSVNAPLDVDLNATGDATFEIGGTITVLPTTADGTYTNTVVVTVEYS